jgi:hypothetical protein
MIEYLKNKGMGNVTDYEFMDRVKEYMPKYRRNSNRYDEDFYDDMDDIYMKRHNKQGHMEDDWYFDKYKHEDKYKRMNYRRHSESMEHFTEPEAKHIVSEMYHSERGKKHLGEVYDMHKAKEICERYNDMLPSSATPADIYIAINAQYHDYSELFKKWFGDNIDSKIIESAIVFWFMDVDYKSKSKVMDYFGE